MAELTVLFGLLFGFIYFVYTSVVLARNSIQLTSVQPVKDFDKEYFEGSVTICIPARNEAKHIRNVVLSALNQQDDNVRVLVLDDGSTDATPTILKTLNEQYNQLTVIEGGERPDGWLGKPWACEQLRTQAESEWVVFVDADTVLKPDFITGMRQHITEYDLKGLTVWPKQELNTPAEKIILPMVYHALLTLLTTIYVYRPPRWLPRFLKHRLHPQFAAACGQCLAFNSDALEKIGGFEGVKNRIVDDVELARLMLSHKLRFRMFHGVGGISCRMYSNYKEIKEGFRKNFFAGFQYSYTLFLFMALLHLVVFILPWITLAYGLINLHQGWIFVSVCLVLIPIIQRYWLAKWFNWEGKWAWTHVLGVLWFQYLGIITLIDRLSGREVLWKGRSVKM